RHGPRRLDPFWVVIHDEEPIHRTARKRPAREPRWDLRTVPIGQRNTLPVRREPKPVEGAHELLSANLPSSEVRAQMRANRVEDGEPTALGPKDDEVPTEPLERVYLPGRKMLDPPERVPAGGVGSERESIAAVSSSNPSLGP